MQFTGNELVKLVSVLTTLHKTHIKLTLSQVEKVLENTIPDEQLRAACWNELRAVLLDALNSNYRNLTKVLNIRQEK